MLEKIIESRVTNYAKNKGWQSIKLSGPNDRGKPDRLFLKDGRAVFVEFKATGKKPTDKQLHEIEKLRKNGFAVFVVDSTEKGTALVDGGFIGDDGR